MWDRVGWDGEGRESGRHLPIHSPPLPAPAAPHPTSAAGICRYNLLARSWKPKKDLSVSCGEAALRRREAGTGGWRRLNSLEVECRAAGVELH